MVAPECWRRRPDNPRPTPTRSRFGPAGIRGRSAWSLVLEAAAPDRAGLGVPMASARAGCGPGGAGKINLNQRSPGFMKLSHLRSPLRGPPPPGLTAALALQPFPAAAQPELPPGMLASTGSDCAIQLSVANPTPGEEQV